MRIWFPLTFAILLVVALLTGQPGEFGFHRHREPGLMDTLRNRVSRETFIEDAGAQFNEWNAVLARHPMTGGEQGLGWAAIRGWIRQLKMGVHRLELTSGEEGERLQAEIDDRMEDVRRQLVQMAPE